ncbi:MAG: SprT family zinc-dependent metalloprotease [Clostridia bacterium]|nr:SprT family zinc-dependent metalloprotease [Clostridia bacterium]
MIDYKIIRSDRKTLAIRVEQDLTITVRAPYFANDKIIAEAVKNNEKWIEKAIEAQRQKNLNRPILSEDDISALKEKAKRIIPERVEHFSKIMGLKPTSIKITSAQKRFGSCSSKNGLCFSYILMLYPPEAIDYVVVHELAHIKEHNHSPRFYAIIERYLPDYKHREKLLKNQPSYNN